LLLLGGAALTPRRPAAAIALISPYVLALCAATIHTAAALDAQARRHVAPAFLAMHTAWGLGFWQGLGALAAARLRRAGRWRWR
jgi:hypothetical protein